MTIRRKFLCTVVPLVLAPVVLFWLTFQLALLPTLDDTQYLETSVGELAALSETTQWAARERFESAMKEAYSFALANIGANIDGKLDAIEKSLLLSATRDDLRNLLAGGQAGETRAQALQYLRDLMETHGLARGALVDDGGRTVVAMERRSGSQEIVEARGASQRATLAEPWFVAALGTDVGTTSWQTCMVGGGDGQEPRPSVSGAVPILGWSEGGTPAGYLHLALPVADLAELIRGPDELTSGIRLVDDAGAVHWSSEGAGRQHEEARALFISQSIRGGALVAEVSIPQELVSANLAPFDTLSAAMDENVARVREEAEALSRTIGGMSILMFTVKLVLLAVAATLVWRLLGRVASRIEVLNQAALRIHDGVLDTPIALEKRGDELASLGTGIEEMRRQIQANIAKLDKKVEERTAELASTNRVLEHEIVERRRAEEAACEANSAKSEFLATMSHEIRTPLSAILGGVNLLSNYDLNEEQETICEIMGNSSRALNALVNDILDLAKIESRNMELSVEHFDVAATAHEVCDTFRFRAKEKGVDLVVRNDLEGVSRREGDPNRVRQIIYNLVGNAVKFTQQGRVAVRLSPVFTDPDFVSICIEDTGIGMSKEQLEVIFQPFTQADSSVNARFGGTGLGLAISCRLAEQMDGKVVVESEEGKGSVFTAVLRLPREVERPELGAEPAESAASPAPEGSGKVLLAEDNDPIRLVMAKVLARAGFTVTEARNGKECLELYGRNAFDLVVLDCAMPVLDGYAAAQSIRAHSEGTDATPILGITAHATKEQQERCKAAGMSQVLFKPIEGALLLEACRAWVGKKD